MTGPRSRGMGVAVGLIAGLFASASAASAEVGAPAATVQAIAADAQFLEYAPPPASPGVVCLIDSGVDPNPDTTPILAGSYALQPGTDTADELSKLNPRIDPGGHPDGHGTYMAMIMAAPVNGWGMVGIAPTSVRVYNVKALPAGHDTFSFSEYANAIVQCADRPAGVVMKVVNLSIGSGTQPTAADADAIQNAVDAARGHDLTVVGAAGNDAGPVSLSGWGARSPRGRGCGRKSDGTGSLLCHEQSRFCARGAGSRVWLTERGWWGWRPRRRIFRRRSASLGFRYKRGVRHRLGGHREYARICSRSHGRSGRGLCDVDHSQRRKFGCGRGLSGVRSRRHRGSRIGGLPIRDAGRVAATHVGAGSFFGAGRS